jgi:uncharacterized membrane protein YedE/YeeE
VKALPAIAVGALFAVGLAISGMADPARVLGFLDLFGTWDPTLAFVMAGAIGVYAPLRLLAKRRTHPLFATQFHEPKKRTIDPKLIGGAALFGVGWGLSGYCPGPALVSAGTGALGVLAFLGAMLAGTALTRWLTR